MFSLLLVPSESRLEWEAGETSEKKLGYSEGQWPPEIAVIFTFVTPIKTNQWNSCPFHVYNY